MIDLAVDFPDPRWWETCREVERSDYAVDVVGRLVQAGYLTVVDTLEAGTRQVGGLRPIVYVWRGAYKARQNEASSYPGL